ncbi:hypothetical protein, variant 2 [Phialophora macrospora]|uniref:Fumarylacetoacetase-like C-terminal domain-containing protein n=1 Tax=Phialophora macrospora TaxID=1851006 RepID=A0A0D2FY63_9EURO|nr:hypothetical protein PV04_03564 [Phialophora macrospora]KIW71389.1 hypothetical protein, variant 1 [Phialophora macrospora]KIW71390.1 hypothetical protein, variant 2 [Phialophora macrospora]
MFAKVLQTNSALDPSATFGQEIVQVKSLLSPLRADEVGTIRCIGLNYRDHAAELKLPIPSTPTVFLKANTCLNSPAGRIYYPHSAGDHDCLLDYEVELAVVIAETCKDVPETDAMQYVLGYMTANDVTSRKHQQEVSQWDHGKGFDGFCPIGPTLVSSQAIPDPSVLRLRTVLNGKVMQDGKARDMIFSVPKIVSFLSQGCTLQKGTIILTGTPCGIGISRDPVVCLSEGDELHVSISHGLGTLTNSISRGLLSERPASLLRL